MKFIITLFYFLFLSNIALAESSADYTGGKLSDMDENFECIDGNGKKDFLSYKKINEHIFRYNYWTDAEALDGSMGSVGNPDSSVKKFDRTLKKNKIRLYMSYNPLYREANLGNGIILKILVQSKIKGLGIQEWTYWVKDNCDKKLYEMLDIWNDTQKNWEDENFDQKLIEWSDEAYNIISRELGFGKPFEIIDLETINLDGIYKHENGNPLTYVSNCKKL